MEKLMLLLLFPLVWPFIAKRIWDTTINWQEMILQILIVVIAVSLTWQAGKYGKTADREILNGQIISKERVHDSYIRTYSCNCIQTCSGSGSSRTCSEICQTCYEDHYTVKWSAKSTVGGILFDYEDSLFDSVYNLPDPEPYAKCYAGEPASKEHLYMNYVKAVPESLFNTKLEDDVFANKIPPYPRVYNFYKVNRVLTVDTAINQNLRNSLNKKLGEALRTLGPQKQVNIILIITSIKNPAYRHSVENAWLGGKKNDVVIFIGVKDEKIIWTDVMTWALNNGNEMLHVKLRDDLRNLKQLNEADKVVKIISKNIRRYYKRPKMESFKYL